MANYVDGFVIPIAKDKISNYRQMAQEACQVWMDHGALEYRECVLEDSSNDFGIPFTKLADASSDQTVIFGWITYKSRTHRDEVNKKVMEDDRMKNGMEKHGDVFDCNQMSYGGFEVLVDNDDQTTLKAA